MEQKMKPINRQLIKVALILAVVTIASLGIRQFRNNTRRGGKVESPVVAKTELESDMDLLRKIEYKLESHYAKASEQDEEVPTEGDFEGKPSKDDYAKDNKDIEKISLGEDEDLYVKGDELWYVSGKIKMQVEIDETTGQMNVINIYDGNSQGSKDLERISMSDNEDLYITGEGDLWHVSRQADGSTIKNRALIDENTGEMILIDPDDVDK
jgi:hypothetical protein